MGTEAALWQTRPPEGVWQVNLTTAVAGELSSAPRPVPHMNTATFRSTARIIGVWPTEIAEVAEVFPRDLGNA